MPQLTMDPPRFPWQAVRAPGRPDRPIPFIVGSVRAEEQVEAVVVDDIAERLRDGSREALEEAYARWASLVHTLAVRSLGNHHDAEDVTQQVFVSAWNSRHTLRPDKGTVPGWLVGITRHRGADVHAKQAGRGGEREGKGDDRAHGLSRGPHPRRDRRASRNAPRHRQEPCPPRTAAPEDPPGGGGP